MKHLSAYEELGAKWRAALHPITDRWPPRHSSLWDATTTSLHGHADTDERSWQCLPSVRQSRQKAGHRYLEPLIGSETGSPSFAPKWPRHHGGPCSESGSVVCCPRRLRPAVSRTHSHCPRSSRAVGRRDSTARRRTRSCFGILGCLLP